MTTGRRNALIVLLIFLLIILGVVSFVKENPYHPVVKKYRKEFKNLWKHRDEYIDTAKTKLKNIIDPPEPVFTGKVINYTGVRLYNKGTVALLSGNYQEAFDYLEQATLVDSGNIDAWTNKALALSRLGKNDEAIQVYEQVLNIDPEISKAWLSKAVIYFNSGDYGQAIYNFDEYLKLEPDNIKVMINKGAAEYATKRYDDAIKTYTQAIAIDSGNKNVWLNKGLSEYQLSKYSEAIISFNKAIKLGATGQVYYQKGLSAYASGLLKTSLKSFTKAIEQDSQNPVLYKNRGQVYFDMGNYKKANEDFDMYLRIKPDDADIRAYKGNALYELGLYNQAYYSYKKSMSLKRNDVVEQNITRAWSQMHKQQ